jgi:formylglycine-generating enzyme required for sulfatase activity
MLWDIWQVWVRFLLMRGTPAVYLSDMLSNQKGCCMPTRNDPEPSPAISLAADSISESSGSGNRDGMVRVEGGRFKIGYEGSAAWESDGEGPVREIELDAYWLDETAVTNEQFAAFVGATGYVT